MSASYEDESYVQYAGVRCCVRVYERYSFGGGNRVSMAMTLVGDGEDLFLSAITSGGSQAMFFKINTWGRKPFWTPSGSWRSAITADLSPRCKRRGRTEGSRSPFPMISETMICRK